MVVSFDRATRRFRLCRSALRALPMPACRPPDVPLRPLWPVLPFPQVTRVSLSDVTVYSVHYGVLRVATDASITGFVHLSQELHHVLSVTASRATLSGRSEIC